MAIVNSSEQKDRSAAADKFWQLYHGRMILVETKQVSGRMQAFGDCLKVPGCSTADTLNAHARALGSVMAQSMAATSKMKYDDFAAKQFRYAGGPTD